jgi:hypothetical protein
MFASFSARERRALQILVVITLITRLVLAFRPEWQIATRPYQEDSFYIFNVAEHLAHGQGITVDGAHATNGIQPLIAFVYAPCFAIAGHDHWLGLRLCFIVTALFDALSVILIALLVRAMMRNSSDDEPIVWLHPPIIAALFWAGLHSVMTHTMNGLETGLLSMMLLASSLFYIRVRSGEAPPKPTQWIVFGILLGFTVLTRIDAVFFVAAFVVVELMRYNVKGVVTGATFGITAVLVSLPWWLYNYFVFGSLMPQSGQSEGLVSVLHENLYRGTIVLGDILSVSLILPNYKLPEWFHYLWFVAALSLVMFLTRRIGAVEYLKSKFDLRGLLPLALFASACIVYYVFFFSAPHFLPRYFHPVRMVWLIVVSCTVPLVASRLRTLYARRRNLAIFGGGLFILAAVGMTAYGYSYHFLVHHPSDLYLTGEWAKEHPIATVGMRQTGISGFISGNVVNLDGKVNFAALQAMKYSDIGAYVVDENLDFVADWPELARPIVLAAEAHGAKFTLTDSIGNVVIYKRVR